MTEGFGIGTADSFRRDRRMALGMRFRAVCLDCRASFYHQAARAPFYLPAAELREPGALPSSVIPVLVTGIQQRRVGDAKDSPVLAASSHHADAWWLDPCDEHRDDGGFFWHRDYGEFGMTEGLG